MTMQRRERREQREKKIIQKTIELLSQRSFFNLRMSDVAKETGYSMGTIYLHFDSKEDLLVACAHSLILEHKALFNSISNQPITAIEKVIILAHCVWQVSMNYPDLIEINYLSLMPSVWHQAKKQRTSELAQLNAEFSMMLLEIVREAIEQNLHGYDQFSQTENEQLARHLTHGVWGLCFGLSSTVELVYISAIYPDKDDERYVSFSTNYSTFLKGYGWQEEYPDAVFRRCKAIAHRCIRETTWFACRNETL